MQKAALVVTLLLSIGSIIFGRMHWESKISAHVASPATVENKTETEENAAAEEASESSPGLSAAYTKNLPKEVQQKFAEAESTKEPLLFLIFGSDTGAGAETPWAAEVKEHLEKAYTPELIRVETVLLADKTSQQVVTEKLHAAGAEMNPDILLFEPFLLKDNGLVGIDNTLINIESLLADFKKNNSSISVFLQPSYPIPGARFYPLEVQQLSKFADEHGHYYLNHWENWPDQESEELYEYVQEDKKSLTETGHKAWADYLKEYFVS
ncbi:hypothetical protein GJU40_16120 [Bacillus lacus]|uniref:SGNH/GDSL hydrolase family protein n=1 Tax=Metabacillus lacus TaxID=1983721 RepID=A0A7X2M141_9BACI|nr:SGNH/GDSL hydrolase family protein [Metabacillus lacus]MRX73669.1 hypothetical protein [Metabacillus lacus]